MVGMARTLVQAVVAVAVVGAAATVDQAGHRVIRAPHPHGTII